MKGQGVTLDEKYSTTKSLYTIDVDDSNLFLPENINRMAEGGLRTKGYYKKSYPGKPLVSIVTVVYNGEKFLEEAIESVINQSYGNIEYVVVDGGSTDNTVGIIKKYDDSIDYWVSEPDEGQSDAFIKAFTICNGHWLTWVNGDDLLLPGAIDELVQSADKHPSVECFTGNIIWVTADNKVIKCRKGEAWNDLLPRLGILTVYGPSTFFKKSLYDRIEGVNKDLHYQMDTDLWRQFYSEGARFRRLKKYTWAFRVHNEAKTTRKFFDSAYSDKNHPFWEQKRKEQDYINREYKLAGGVKQRMAKALQFAARLTSTRYLGSVYSSIRYKNHPLYNLCGREDAL